MNIARKIISPALALAFSLLIVANAFGQEKNFTPVEGATLKARIENGMAAGRANAQGGRFWVAYQFEARPGVAVDFEMVDGNGGLYISDGMSVSFDSRYETRELGLFLLFETPRGRFTRAEVYNLKRTREFSGYPVYWAGRVSNEESLSYLKSIIDTNSPDTNRLADRAAFAIALHDDAQVESILIGLIRRPVNEPMRSRTIFWLGYTPESATKNAFLQEIIRNEHEWSEPRQQAMAATRDEPWPANLPVLENLYETMTSRDLKRGALAGIARNDNRDRAATYLNPCFANEKTRVAQEARWPAGPRTGDKEPRRFD